MSSPPLPPSLDQLITRPFAFYPPILNIAHNEWLFRKATWSEILVVNSKNGEEAWIPRRYLGEVSRVDDPILIVGLNKELEYKAGAVWPYQRRLIEMPMAVGGNVVSASGDADRNERAPIVGIRVPPSTDSRMFRLIGAALAIGVLLYLGAVNLVRTPHVLQGIRATTADQDYLELTSRDDYTAVVAKLGPSSVDRWSSQGGEIHFRALGYPGRSYTVILMGSDPTAVKYIGTMDNAWRPIHSVDLRSGGTTSSLLRGLARF